MARKKKRRNYGDGRTIPLPDGRFRAVASLGTNAKGKRVRKTRTFRDRESAEGWLEAQRAAQQDWAGGWTVAGWMQHWLDTLKPTVEHATWKFYKERSDLYVVPRLGTLKLGDLTKVRVEAWMNQMGTDKVPAGQRFRSLKTLRAAVRASPLKTDPTAGVKPPKRPKRKITPLTKEEARRFLETAAGTRYAALWRLFLDSGMRPAELLALHFEDLDFAAGTVHVHRSIDFHDGEFHFKAPKTPKGDRVVMLAPATVDALRQHTAGMKEGDLVFRSSRGNPMHVRNLNRQYFVPLHKKAKVPKVRMYDLRHTSATLLLSVGVSLRVVADRLGHEDPAVTLRYYAGSLPQMQEEARQASQGLYG